MNRFRSLAARRWDRRLRRVWRRALARGGGSSSAIPAQAEGASPGEVDSLFRLAESARSGAASGATRSSISSACCWSSLPAIRAFRRRGTSSARPSSPSGATSRPPASSAASPTRRRTTGWRPRRCSGWATSTPISGAGPSWIPPTARRRSPPTRSCSTATPTRPAAARAQERIDGAAGALRLQGVSGGALLLQAQGLRLGDPLPEGRRRDVPARHRSRPTR